MFTERRLVSEHPEFLREKLPDLIKLIRHEFKEAPALTNFYNSIFNIGETEHPPLVGDVASEAAV